MTPTRAVYSARSSRSLLAARSVVVTLARSIFAITSTAYASPIDHQALGLEHYEEEGEGDTVVLAIASLVLVLLGGAFAGLTIALMGQDGIYLQVIARDHTEPQHRNARRVYELLQRGKHWVLVTLLLSNVIVNETLPVVLDRCLGGGVAAVAGSTVLIVIFGEVIPQSLCVRYGLQIGGYMSQPVLLLMYLMAPLAWPTAKLLDWLLGEDHGTVYKKSGLKTLVTLHETLGDVSDRLNQDEVTIISAVLDLKEKPVLKVMTPMADVFTMSEDTVLDEQTMNMILSAGYSRIPIHETGHLHNFVGMLLVKILITYDPEDCKRVRDFPLATLPETRPETSCLDIVNFFQEGKSHMVLVSEYPGEDRGALGVVTLEDVIEELIGEEIIDESDVYIDVHKAIRRLAPAPRATIQPRASEDRLRCLSEDTTLTEQTALPGFSLSRSASETNLNEGLPAALSSSPKTATFMMRRHSGVGRDATTNSVTVRANIEDLREHLKHLGPSNPATNPKSTKSTTVKVKPGSRTSNMAETATDASINTSQQDESTRLLATRPAGSEPRAIVSGYGSTLDATDGMRDSGHYVASETDGEENGLRTGSMTRQTASSSETNNLDVSRGYRSDFISQTKTYVRSGSITENIFETRGVRKVVLEPTSSQEDDTVVASTAADQNRSKNRLSLGLFTLDPRSGDASLVSASPADARDGGREGDSTEEKDGDDHKSPEESSSRGAAQGGVKKKQRKKKRTKANLG